jgi:hypothetical protein
MKNPAPPKSFLSTEELIIRVEGIVNEFLAEKLD